MTATRNKTIPFLLPILVFSISLLVSLIIALFFIKPRKADYYQFGVTFSPRYAQELGLSWKSLYLEMFSKLNIKRLRLPVYWDTLEPENGKFDFSQTDYLITGAEKNNAQVLLVVGMKQPRWPECFMPSWVKKLPEKERREKLLASITTIINRYKGSSAVWGWQVENEPLMKFGEGCDKIDRNFLKSEVETVRQLDPTRPVVLTDSGELRPWRTPMRLSDVFGTTLYRKVEDRIFGVLYFPFPPSYYALKSGIVNRIFAPKNQRTFIAELQAEPWTLQPVSTVSTQGQVKSFSTKQFLDNINFAKQTGFSEIYLWGVEWWFYMEDKGHPEYLEFAEQLFKD